MAEKTSFVKKKLSDSFSPPDFLKPENRPVQYFTQEYIDQCKKMSREEIVEKISEQQEFFWKMHLGEEFEKSQLISIKIPRHLLKAFRDQCDQSGVKYQTQIKKLMLQWLLQK